MPPFFFNIPLSYKGGPIKAITKQIVLLVYSLYCHGYNKIATFHLIRDHSQNENVHMQYPLMLLLLGGHEALFNSTHFRPFFLTFFITLSFSFLLFH